MHRTPLTGSAMDYAQSLCVILTVILVLMVWAWYRPSSSEHFDTYYNHYMGAQDVYARDELPFSTGPAEQPLGDDIDSVALLAKYNWSEKDPKTGMDVYDYYYEHHLENVAYPDAYADISPFPASKMKLERSPGVIFNGEIISLSQKNR
jgi:hypothetical protein